MSELETSPIEINDSDQESPENLPSPEQRVGRVVTECFSRDKESLPDPYPYKVLQYKDAETTQKLQRSYVRHTAKLISRVEEEDIDHTVFLDKSARPVAWMMNELWDDFAYSKEDGDEEVHEKPGESFLNIDREQWRNLMGGKEIGSGMINADRVDQSIIDSLRYIFVTGRKFNEYNEDVTSESVWDMPTVLDDKNVLIVDEVKFSGDSAQIARKLLRRAIPEAHIQHPYHWMVAETGRDGSPSETQEGLPNVPVWYSDRIEGGRWIGNRDRQTSSQSVSNTQREGYMFLSTRQEEVDTKSRQLRAECKALARDYEEGKYGVLVG